MNPALIVGLIICISYAVYKFPPKRLRPLVTAIKDNVVENSLLGFSAFLLFLFVPKRYFVYVIEALAPHRTAFIAGGLFFAGIIAWFYFRRRQVTDQARQEPE